MAESVSVNRLVKRKTGYLYKMDKFTKIILERLTPGDIALKLAPSSETFKYLKDYGNETVETFQVIERLGNINASMV